MSVLKAKRTTSKAEFVNKANEIYVETLNFLTRMSARYSRILAEPVALLAGEVIDHAEKANSIFPSDAQRIELRKAHLIEARASLMALDVRLTHCYMVMSQNPQGAFTTDSKCKIIPLTKPFRFCKAKFTLTETGRVIMNGNRDGMKRARRKIKLFHREYEAGRRSLADAAEFMQSQCAYYENYDDHGRLLRLRRYCYAIFGGAICSKSSEVMAASA